jgi:toxin ParE1/3/4
MDYKIRWAPRAVENFENICNYISKDSLRYASLVANKINNIIKSIPEYPHSGRIVPEYRDINLREKVYKNYRIVY